MWMNISLSNSLKKTHLHHVLNNMENTQTHTHTQKTVNTETQEYELCVKAQFFPLQQVQSLIAYWQILKWWQKKQKNRFHINNHSCSFM